LGIINYVLHALYFISINLDEAEVDDRLLGADELRKRLLGADELRKRLLGADELRNKLLGADELRKKLLWMGLYCWNVRSGAQYGCIYYKRKLKVKQSGYTPWRRLGGEEV
jgi:hypothetical protein